MPKSQASPEQIETYLNQERSKRRDMLQKFLDQCREIQVSSSRTSSCFSSLLWVGEEEKTQHSNLFLFSSHTQVTVDVYLIESDQIANAIIELVPVLRISQLVLGVSKSNVRYGLPAGFQVNRTHETVCMPLLLNLSKWTHAGSWRKEPR